MVTVEKILDELSAFAPLELKESWDNCGLLMGNKNEEVSGVLICLDVTDEAISKAQECGCNLIVSHHPAFFYDENNQADISEHLLRSNVAVISMHTNLDICKGGVNDTLAQIIQLEKVVSFSVDDQGEIGRLGYLKNEMTLNEFIKHISSCLPVSSLRTNLLECTVKKVAIICGSGADGIEIAVRLGADAFVTGDVKYHKFLDAKANGLLVVDAGHYATEIHVVDIIENVIRSKYDIKCEKFSGEDVIKTITESRG